jgi:putative membrane protein
MMTMTLFLQPGGWWWHGGGGWAWAWIWWPLSTVIWVTVIAGVIWLLCRGSVRRERTGLDRAREILAERYARGELTSDEYRERLEQLA